MKTNQDYKNAALEALKGCWPVSIVAVIVYMAIAGVCLLPSFLPASAVGAGTVLVLLAASLVVLVLVAVPAETGLLNSFKRLYAKGDDEVLGNIFKDGFGNWAHVAWGGFLVGLFCLLWSCLFLIPGIVKTYSYSMTPYILLDDPDLTASQAIGKSRAMMKGHKLDLFCLHLSFIGWWLLGILTLGIGFLWLMPYLYTAQAAFYADVRAEYETNALK